MEIDQRIGDYLTSLFDGMMSECKTTTSFSHAESICKTFHEIWVYQNTYTIIAESISIVTLKCKTLDLR